MSPLRRRLFGGVAGGVLLAVPARTALGSTGPSGICRSPSADMSGNTSPRQGDGTTCSGGRSPGFWVQPQKFPNWPAPTATPPTFSTVPEPCSVSGQATIDETVMTSAGTQLSSVFPGAPTNNGVNALGVGLWQALAFPQKYGQLLRHLTAAYLNALSLNSTGANYPLSPEQVIDMWNQLQQSGSYCPQSMINCGDLAWGESDVIAYIEGLYDINSDSLLNLCKPNKP